jgi:hypothetical protein
MQFYIFAIIAALVVSASTIPADYTFIHRDSECDIAGSCAQYFTRRFQMTPLVECVVALAPSFTSCVKAAAKKRLSMSLSAVAVIINVRTFLYRYSSRY